MEQSQCADAEQVIRRYADMVYRLAYSYVRSRSDADDIFQEVFLRYVRDKPVFDSDEHCKAWLLRVTANCAKKHLANPFRQRTQPLDDAIPFPEPAESALDDALRHLSPRYRAVVHLFYYEGCSTEEIARLLGRKPSTVRTQLTRARAELARLLKGDHHV